MSALTAVLHLSHPPSKAQAFRLSCGSEEKAVTYFFSPGKGGINISEHCTDPTQTTILLHLYSNMIFLEAMDDSIILLPSSSEVYFPSRDSSGIKLRKSSNERSFHVQLRHHDRFQVDQNLFQLELQVRSYNVHATTLISLESSSEAAGDLDMLDDELGRPNIPGWASNVANQSVIEEIPSRSQLQMNGRSKKGQSYSVDPVDHETIKPAPVSQKVLPDSTDDPDQVLTGEKGAESLQPNSDIPPSPVHRGVSELKSLDDSDTNTTQASPIQKAKLVNETNTDSMIDEPDQNTHYSPAHMKPSKASQSPEQGLKPDMKVMFASSTNVDSLDAIMKPLRKAGLQKVEAVTDCDILCVGKGPLKKTSNIIIAISSGKQIVSETWARDSAKQKQLLNPSMYLAGSSHEETGWGIGIKEAIDRGKNAPKPLAGHTILISPDLQKQLGKGYEDIKLIASHGGASSVHSRLPAAKDRTAKTLVISSPDDPHLAKLSADGWTCYTKDLITMTVLRSALDLKSKEFVIGEEEKALPPPKTQGKKRKR